MMGSWGGRADQLGVRSWWKERSTLVRDAVGAVPLVLTFLVAQQLYGPGGPWLRAVTIVAVIWVSVAVRRRWPTVTFAAALSTVLVAMTGLEFLAVASYTLVAYRPRVPAPLVILLSAVATTAGFMRWWPSLAPEVIAGDLILIVSVSVLPVVLGRAVAHSRRVTSELESRNAELVALRRDATTHAVQRERYRIAREIHDVVAHHVSAMTVRARAGRHLAERDPEAASEALDYVAREGTCALTAMGSVVGALRGKDVQGHAGFAAPQPGLSDLPALLEGFRGTGLVIHADLAAAPTPVPPALGLATFRIVQEALTNALRHGAAEHAWVRVGFRSGQVQIQVDDNGHGLQGPPRPRGNGLIGVSERVALYGGESQLVDSPRGGLRLEAMMTLPTSRSAASDPSHPDSASS